VSDRELVAALGAGDRLAAGQVYDVYGTRLYAYCHELLADPKLSADALRDTFIVAASRIKDLTDPDEFGAWLYALARAECVRVGISDDAPADAASAARGDRLARLALDVYSMLEPDERELVDLAFRHRLEDSDLALVLGEDQSAVSVRVSKAQADLEIALLVVLAARTGDPRCQESAEFGRKFDEIDGKGIPAWLQAASKHVEKCTICGDAIRNRRPLRLFEELPHSFMPPGVRSRVLEALRDPAGAVFAEQITDRAGKFDDAGFPAGGGGKGGAGSLKRWILPSAGLLVAGCAVALFLAVTSDHPATTTTATSTTSVQSGSPATGSTSSFGELTASASATSTASASKSATASASTSAAQTMVPQQTTTTAPAGPTTKSTTCTTKSTSTPVTVHTTVQVTITVTPPAVGSASPVPYTTTSPSPTTIVSQSPTTIKSCN
jgi:DNA-directed RNA polymerase specialized sigma24 family protein